MKKGCKVMVGDGSPAGNDGFQGVLCPLPARSLYDHPLRGGFYDQAHLEGLVESIRANGLWEPLLVRPRGGTEREFEVISGHYRLRAVRRLRQPMVMSRIVICDDHTAKMIFCMSRLLTKGLTAIEEALILREVVESESLSMSAAGSLFGQGKSWVSRRLKLLAALEPGLQGEVNRGSQSSWSGCPLLTGQCPL
ncbi:MAG: ParB/RepB/Spo0J family partition protein [Peptococcaceae bacterium]|nr:ParB/RepB/Spo0J family partition protein [Peptococcaceae bacterium]